VSPRARRLVVRSLVVAASVAVALALLAGYARRVAVDSEQFANRATAALRDDSVRALVAQRITDDVVLANAADLTTARPIIESAASGIVGSRAFTGLFRSAVSDVHRAVLDRDQDTVTLTVADVGTVLAAVLERARPALAGKLQSTDRVTLLRRDMGRVGGDLARLADRVRVLALVLLVLAAALATAALAVSRNRRGTIVELGIGIAASGALLVLACGIARSLAIDQVDGPENRAAVAAIWDAFLGDLRTAAAILAGSGAVIAAAAASLIQPVDARAPLRRAVARLTAEPRHPAWRAARGTALVAAGLLVIFEHDAVLQIVFTGLGVYLVYEGLTALLRLVNRSTSSRSTSARRPASEGRVRLPGRGPITGLLAVVLIAVAVAAFVGAGGTTTAAPAPGPCNGHEELCARRLDQLALPATHNSMSAPAPGKYSSQQDRPIDDQLADGIRGLLIDTHYADRLPNGRLRTHLGSRAQLRRRAGQDGVSAGAVDAALRLRDRLGFAGQGERGMYLCHTLCELGGVSLDAVLDDLHDFLIANPDEVVVVINQDYVKPVDFVDAVKNAGLAELAYRGPVGAGAPTLREMIDRNRRVLFLAENRSGTASWYRPAYDGITQETPYSFGRAGQLTQPAKLPASCETGRGDPGSPLFLVNHWITTDPVPRPSNAAKVNAYAPLLRRTRECERLRHRLPNLVAVDFYRRGDLFRVVDTLNGVRPPRRTP
jgi:hypothetical protein